MPSSRDLPTQGSNPGLPHCRWILYHLSHLGSPLSTGVLIKFLSAPHWDSDTLRTEMGSLLLIIVLPSPPPAPGLRTVGAQCVSVD